jgi:hypothetical protein
MYLEAEQELSLAAYLAEFADILGNGSLELFDKLASVIVQAQQVDLDGEGAFSEAAAAGIRLQTQDNRSSGGHTNGQVKESRSEILEKTPFWGREKAIAILSGNRQLWLEVTSSSSLTLRPPHGIALGVDLINGQFVTDESRRNRRRRSL